MIPEGWGDPAGGGWPKVDEVFNGFGDLHGVDVQRPRINVHEDRDGAFVENDIRRGDEGEWGGDDQIGFANAGSYNGEMESCRAA